MPIYINKATGQAEATDTPSANHEVPLVSPDGTLGSAPATQVPSLLNQGYRQTVEEENKGLLKKAAFETPIQQGLTALEGAASAATLGLSTAAQAISGKIPLEDVAARREINPGVYTLGQVGGLGISALSGLGAIPAAEAIAAPAAAALFGAETAASRVGSMATKAAIENMIVQLGDENTKAFLDPNYGVESAIANIGLAGVLGAGLGTGFGATSEAWKGLVKPNVDRALNAYRARMASKIPTEVSKIEKPLVSETGVPKLEVPDVLKAALDGNQDAIATVQYLQESASKAGDEMRAEIAKFRNAADENIIKTIGLSPDDAIATSDAAIGKEVQQSVINKISEAYEPISKQYEAVAEQFKATPILPEQTRAINEALTNLSIQEGWAKAPSGAENKLFERVLKEMPLQTTADDLKKYITNLQRIPYSNESYQAAKRIVNVLKNEQENAIEASLRISTKSGITPQEYSALRASYKGLMENLEELNDRLRVGTYHGPETFLENLKGMDPEAILKRLSPDGDVNTGMLLQSKYPELTAAIRNAELTKIMKAAAGKDTQVSFPKLFNKLDKLSPEMKSFLFTPEQAQQLDFLRSSIEALPKTTNPSGTARTLHNLILKDSDNAITSAYKAITDPLNIITKYLSHALGKEGPDAVKLAQLKFLASDAAVNAEGFKATAEMAKAVLKGEKNFNKAANVVIGEQPENVIKFPTSKDRDILKKQIDEISVDKSKLMETGGNLGHYMPEHAITLAATTARNLEYLASLKPQTPTLSPLDAKKVASDTEEAKYNRALDIAQNPLIIMESIKNGSITLADMRHVQTMYPTLFEKMQHKLLEQVMISKNKGKILPYKTKFGLSAFLGQPLESSMQPTSIMTNQLTFVSMPPQQQQPQQIKNVDKLDKLPNQNMSKSQAREASKTKVH